MTHKISIILPCKNEAGSLKTLLPELQRYQPHAEIIVVDDGSTDDSAQIAMQHGVQVVSHPYSKGNGAAIKTGARVAQGDILIFMDADGQHQPVDIARLLEKIEQNYDMVVGARDSGSQASFSRGCANRFYNWLATWMVGHLIEDLTSGFRAVRAEKFREFLHLLPNTFSYPSTITMAFFRAGYSVGYLPITALQRVGKSHIKPLRDGLRFLLIIFQNRHVIRATETFWTAESQLFSARFGLLCLHIHVNESVYQYGGSVVYYCYVGVFNWVSV